MNLRRDQILQLAEKCRYEQEHSHHVMMLAVKLFDSLQELHHFSVQEREWLEYASLLHDIGWIEGRQAHHKTALRLIINADLPLFSQEEKVLIGLIARYHRKSLPKDKHDFYGSLNPENKIKVSQLASFLRLADGLDRTHSSCIEDFECMIDAEKIILRIKEAQCFSAEDKQTGLEKSDLLQKMFHRKLVIEWE